ncbi:MAG: PTS sugar transporter subunit IIA [Pseudomonadota bacterium]
MAKSLRGIIKPQHIHLDVAASCKRSILETLGGLAARDFGLDASLVHDKLMDRESLGTTGVGGGIAIPHARVEVGGLSGLFVRLRDKIGFDSVDGDPVDLVFLLLAPDADNSNHLKALSRVARTLKTPGVLDSLRGATNVDAAYAALVSESDAEAA